MSQETERKFIVKGDFSPYVGYSRHIMQGYLNSSPDRTVRVRIKGEKGYITVKGPSDEAGLSRYEWEKEIDIADAEELMSLCESGIIDKTRYYVTFEDHLFEVDVFHGENEGLVLAEVELASPDESFACPHWLGDEVTGDVRYYNSYLSAHPFSAW